MQVTFLGCLGSQQSEKIGNTSLVLKEGSDVLLVDCSGSPSGMLRLVGADPAALSAVILTHAHIDHLYALPSLLHNMWLAGRKRVLPLFGNRETLEIARKLCAVFSLEQKSHFFGIEWHEEESATIGSLRLRFFATDHGFPSRGLVATETNGTLTYTSDTRPMELPPYACDAAVLVHEASGLSSNEERLRLGGHSSASDAARCAKESGAAELLLCHLPPEKDIRDRMLVEARGIFQATAIPQTGKWFEVKVHDA